MTTPLVSRPRDPSEPTPTFAEYGWLPAVLPAEARRLRVTDRALEYTLRHSGAELVDAGGDVEIGSPDELTGDAPVAVVSVNTVVRNVPSRARRATARVARSVDARLRAERLRRRLRRRGYADVRVVPWDVEQVLRLPGLRRPARLGVVQQLPRRALVVATRSCTGPTGLEVAVAAAAAVSGDTTTPTWPLLRAGSLIAIADRTVVRVAIGPGRERLDRQAAALAELAAAGPPQAVASVVPRVLGDGDAGLAHWWVEQRLPGTPAPDRIAPVLLADCLAFLEALERCDVDGDAAPTAAARAEALARLLPGRASQLAAIGAAVDVATASLPRVYGHGDFWSNNLLVEEGRLSGVVDWESAGPGRLPLLDLFQLTIVDRMQGDAYGWGRAIVEHLLPACRAGGDELTRSYLARTGLDVAPRALEAVALAYWLERAAYQLTAHVGRLRDPAWLAANVELVLSSLPEHGQGRAR